MHNEERLVQVLTEINDEYEGAIEDPDENENHLIRTQSLIQKIHNYVMEQLELNGIDSEKITEDETIYGYPKKKEQDILVKNQDESIITGPLLSINVRSQLSSIAKNIDTLHERIFAESANLHNRFPYLPCGYVYLLPLTGYDSDAKNHNNEVKFSENYDLEKMIDSFDSISGRSTTEGENWKYEAMWLLIVDFDEDPPEIIDDMSRLAEKGRVSQEFAETYDSQVISAENFFDRLITLYKKRYALSHDFNGDSGQSEITDH